MHAPSPPPQPGPDGKYHHDDDPIPETEAERRDQWNLVPKTVCDELEKLHANLVHPSAAGMVRLLRRSGALKDVVRAAGLLSCTIFLNFQNIKAARVSRLQEVYEFNVRVLLGTIFIHDVVGGIFIALNILCDGTTFQVVMPLGAGPVRASPAQTSSAERSCSRGSAGPACRRKSSPIAARSSPPSAAGSSPWA